MLSWSKWKYIHYLFLDVVCRINDVIDIWTHVTLHSKIVTDFRFWPILTDERIQTMAFMNSFDSSRKNLTYILKWKSVMEIGNPYVIVKSTNLHHGMCFPASSVFVLSILFWIPQRMHYFWRVYQEQWTYLLNHTFCNAKNLLLYKVAGKKSRRVI